MMKLSRLWILFFTVLPAGLLGQSLPTVSPEEVGLSAARLDRLNTVMAEYVEEGKVPGLVTLVLRDGKIVHHESHGDLDPETATPMPQDAIFRIASQSKAVTSTAIMILLEEGKLRLSDPLSKFIPEFADPKVAVPSEDGGYREVQAHREITIHNLLTHTSGLSYGHGSPAEKMHAWEDVLGWYFADQDRPIGEAIRRLAHIPLVSQPSEEWVYGFSTDVLGHVVEKASGLTLAEFFQERIFTPLKMNDTHFYLPESKIDRFTPVYGREGEGPLYLVETPQESDYVYGPRTSYSGGAGLLSTALDYGRFLLALMNGGSLEGERILSPKSVELMTVNHVGDLFGEDGFGLGFWIERDLGQSLALNSVGAYGWGGAYHTVYWVDPEEKLVGVLMCQLRPAGSSDLHETFRNLVYQSIVESATF